MNFFPDGVVNGDTLVLREKIGPEVIDRKRIALAEQDHLLDNVRQLPHIA